MHFELVKDFFFVESQGVLWLLLQALVNKRRKSIQALLWKVGNEIVRDLLISLLARLNCIGSEEILALSSCRIFRAGQVEHDDNDLTDQEQEFKRSVRCAHLSINSLMI